MEFKFCETNGRRLTRTHEVLDMSREKTISALVLEPGKEYMWNIKTLNKTNREKDEWYFNMIEDPYSEDEIMCEGEDHLESYCYLKYFRMRRKKKIHGGKYGIEIRAPLERFIFWVAGDSVGCDFCDVVWIKVWLTQYKDDRRMLGDTKDFKMNIPFYIENKSVGS